MRVRFNYVITRGVNESSQELAYSGSTQLTSQMFSLAQAITSPLHVFRIGSAQSSSSSASARWFEHTHSELSSVKNAQE